MSADVSYHPNAEQHALAQTIDESLKALLPLSRLHSAHNEDATTWASLEEIGIFSIGLSESLGGSGLGVVEEALIVNSLGQRLAAPSVLATIGAAQTALHERVSALRGLRVAAAYRSSQRVVVIEDPDAAFILLRDAQAAALHQPTNTALALDERLWLVDLSECNTAALGDAAAELDVAAVRRLRLLDAAALAGIAEGALDMGVAYAQIRSQFGRPIGSFQAVKHHCANMAIAARSARDQVNFAAVALAQGRADAPLQVECAFFIAGSAALENAGLNIQIHGGIGFSDEADPHLFLKRARVLIAIGGGLEAANARVAAAEAR